MVVHEECAFRPLETLDFPSPLVELLDAYFPASLEASTLQLLGWRKVVGKRGCIALPSIDRASHPRFSRRIIDVVGTTTFR